MEFQDFLKLIGRKKQAIFIFVFVAIILTVGLSLISPLKYGAKSKLLVLQDSSTTDAYALSKSNEYLGNLLSQVVYSGSFYDQVRASSYGVDGNYFSGTYNQQIKKWRQTISAKTSSDTGIIEVNIYHPSVEEAKKIALAVNYILVNNNQDYHGGQNVKVNVIDQPLVSAYPVKPNLPFNAALAAGLSLLLAIFYFYLFPENTAKQNVDRRHQAARPAMQPEENNEQFMVDNAGQRQIDGQNGYYHEQLAGNIHNVLRK